MKLFLWHTWMFTFRVIFFLIIQNHLHNVHHWAAPEFPCRSQLGWFLRPQCSGGRQHISALYHLKKVQKHDGPKFWWLYTTVSGWRKGASVYSCLSTYTSQMLTYSILFYSDKHRRHKKEIWKFFVHLDTWCYSLFVSEKVNHFVML